MGRPSNTVLVIQHVHCEPPALYEDLLLQRGFSIHRVEIDEGEPLPADIDFRAVIVMGGPMGALDDDVHPWLATERAYIARAVQAGVPYWGVCLGAQLLAAALGARVFRGDNPEVGIYDVSLTEEAASDPVFAGLPSDFPVFQWHSDTFDIPSGARHLARSTRFPNQVFALGSSYGIQFHVEVTAELAAQWAEIKAYGDALEAIYGPGATEKVLGELADNLSNNAKIATAIFEAWLDTYLMTDIDNTKDGQFE
jgi:GMP synthase (glutamine-hydrolysing)